jgi:hypothetical protein
MILDVKFAAFNRKHRKTPKMLDLNDPITIMDASMNPGHSIFFVTHGFLEYGGAPWIKKLADELLVYDKHATVIVIDWKSGSSPPYYQGEIFGFYSGSIDKIFNYFLNFDFIFQI